MSGVVGSPRRRPPGLVRVAVGGVADVGDRTYYSLTLPVTTPPEALRAAVSAFTEEHWTLEEATATLRDHASCVTVCVPIEERRMGECRVAADAVLAALADLDVAVPFAVVECPKYEFLGTVCRYLPELGMHEVQCDADGTALLPAHVLRTLTTRRTDPVAVLAEVRAHLGTAWDSVLTGCVVTP